MKKPNIRMFLAASLLLAVPGCTTLTPPVEVTRFHALGGAPLAPGQAYRIAATDGSEPGFVMAVDRELQRLGLVAAEGDGATAPLAVRVDATRSLIQPAPRGSPVSVGIGGGTGSYGSGVGVGIGINLSGAPKPQVAYRLAVRIDAAATGTALWEGRAETQVPQSAPAAQGDLAAAKMAAALFKDFPGASGATISVP